MTSIPQPPDPLLPPDTGAPRRRLKISDLVWLLVIAILLLALLAPVFLRRPRGGDERTEAMNNMRSVGMMLLEFDNEYGNLPSATTAIQVKSATSTPLTLGNTSSNQLFRQLLAGGGGKSEKPFWAKTAISPKKPDDVFHNDATAIAPGECGFAYIAGLESSDDPDTPVLMAPLLPGKLTFDPKPFAGKAVVLFLNNSATALPIDKHGQVILKNGLDLFDPRQPFWHGKAPDVKWPE